ncbi:MAG: SpoIIE family protein phosphatase [Bacteroidales bacterium]|nr:SpoIIE family protein phosphatase [Bacteroidales bacterium]
MRVFNGVGYMYCDDEGRIWLISNNNVYLLTTDYRKRSHKDFLTFIDRLTDKKGQALADSNEIRLKFKNNALKIDLAALFFLSEEHTLFQYKLEGLDNGWTEWDEDPEIFFPYIPVGKYELKVRAKNIFGEISETKPLKVTVEPPFWQTTWFYILCLLAAVALAWAVMVARTRKLEHDKQVLQKKVDQATAEIRKQKDELEVAYTDIAKKNKDITNSINYAQRIQQAVLPEMDKIKEVLPESFVLYRPRDIVSGDFFWFFDNEEFFVLIASDCTGHGVPGAFMSLIGNTLLNQIIREGKQIEPEKILARLDTEIIGALKQDLAAESRDGMDITICTYLKYTKQVFFAGAMNPIVYFKNGEMHEADGDFFPIGGVYANIKKQYHKQVIEVDSSMSFYMFSDGYADQFGGEKRKKFMKGNFKKLLKEIHNQPFEAQREILDKRFDAWKGNRVQNDDVLVIGFKIPTG